MTPRRAQRSTAVSSRWAAQELDAAAAAADADINRRVGASWSGCAFGTSLPHRRDKNRRRRDSRTCGRSRLTRPYMLRLASGDPARANAIRDMVARLTDACEKSPILWRKSNWPRRWSATRKRLSIYWSSSSRAQGWLRRGDDHRDAQSRSRCRPLFHLYRAGGSLFAGQDRGDAQVDGPDRGDRVNAHSQSDHLDANGNLPITVQVDERKQYAVSAAAQYSTIDGPSARAEWVNRNVFGGGAG